MIPIGQLIVTTAEAVGEVFNRRKSKTPTEIERRRNEHATLLFILALLILIAVLLAIMARK